MKKNNIALLLFFIFLCANISNIQGSEESLGTFKIGEDVLLIQLCGSCTFNNITSVTFPNNASELISNVQMVKDGTKFTYLLDKNNITEYGVYNVNGFGDKDGVTSVWAYTFNITPSGEALRGDNFMIFLYVLFLLIILLSFYLLIINIAKLVSATETILGVAFSWSVYFGLILLSWLINNYSTSSFLRENMVWIISSFGFSNFLLPLIALFIAMTARGFKEKRPLTVEEIMGRRLLGNG